jgi:mono/diheme cytochrome c family protein
MWNQSRLKPLEESPVPGEGSSSRPLPPGTMARGERGRDDPVVTGRGADGKLVTKIPIAVTKAMLERGQERFNIYCSPCHNRIGDGRGMIVKRGFPHPPDYALVRLRNAPVGHFYDVITNGYGVMYSYAARVEPEDRWAIAAYIRALQASRPVVKVDPYEQERLRARRTGIGTQPVP